jgi:hypothetical protein
MVCQAGTDRPVDNNQLVTDQPATASQSRSEQADQSATVNWSDRPVQADPPATAKRYRIPGQYRTGTTIGYSQQASSPDTTCTNGPYWRTIWILSFRMVRIWIIKFVMDEMRIFKISGTGSGSNYLQWTRSDEIKKNLVIKRV